MFGGPGRRVSGVLAAVAFVSAFAGVAYPRAHTKAPTTTVHVVATEFRFALSRKSASVGTVRFVVVNRGATVHNFAIAGKATPLLKTGKQATLTIRFKKAGSFPYRCTVPGHAHAGMQGTFRVGKPAKRSPPPTTTTATTTTTQSLTLTQLASGLGLLTDVEVDPNDPNRLFVLEQTGKVTMIDNGTTTLVADFGGYVKPGGGENGLLGMTFSPTFTQDRIAYFYFTNRVGNANDTLVAVKLNPDWTPNWDSLRTVLEVRTYGANHRGGDIAFGPDGHLYVPMGDSDDGTYTVIGQYAQDSSSMLGGIARIDPTPYSPQPNGLLYSIPADNPWVNGGEPPESWAKGLRNPWRDYVDAATGLYYIGDVGEDNREEIDVVPISSGGFNFGWPCMEGTEVRSTSVTCPPAAQLTPPALDYDHSGGRCAVIAGVVAHDPRLPSLEGDFLYTDDCAGDLRAFKYENGAVTDDRALGLNIPGGPDSFGEGPDGRVYVVNGNGDVYRLDPAS